MAAVAVGALLRGGGSPPTAAGAPPIELPDLRRASATISLEDFRGRPLVINVFASWCSPCKKELPLLRDAHARLRDRVGFLGVDHLDDAKRARAMLDEFGITYPAGYDPDGDVARRYRLRGLPATVFLDARGRIAGTLMGQLDEAELGRYLAMIQR